VKSATATNTHTSSYRAIAWCWFALVVATGAGFAALWGSWDGARTWSDVLTYELPMAGALVLSVLLVRRTRGSIERRLWVHTSIACGLVLVAEVYWTWYAATVDPSGPPPTNPIMLLYLAAGAAFLSIVFTMTRFPEEPLTEQLRFLLDVSAGLLAVFPILYLAWTLPMMEALPGGGWQAAALAGAYPLFGMLMLVATVAVVVGWRAHRWSSWERLVAIALVLDAVTLATWPMWYANHLQGGTGLSRYASILGIAFALFSVGMVYRLTDPSDEALLEPWPVPRPDKAVVVRAYPVFLAVALPVLGVAAFEIGERDHGFPVGLAVTLLAVVLVARSVTVSIEQAGNLQKAYVDPATGVLNRTWLDTMLRRKLADAESAGGVMSVAVFDVADEDRFNAVIGHSAGEAALVRVAAVLAEEAPAAGEVFALSSYEFVMMLPGMDASEAAVLARRTWLRLLREALVDGRPLDIAAGIAAYPQDALDAASLVASAEDALGEARGSEAEPVVTFSERSGTEDQGEVQQRARMRAIRSTIRMLAEAVDARDSYTRDHSANVSELATALAQVMDLSDDEVQLIGLAALVHDVGKVGVHDEVLLNGAALSASERTEMESHAVLGERILAPTRIDDVLPIVRSHHERWDGRGYPDGLKGEAIPAGARILAVCDAFEAMTAGRAYQAALSRQDALAEIENNAGTQFDPLIAATFWRMVMQLEVARGEQPVTFAHPSFEQPM